MKCKTGCVVALHTAQRLTTNTLHICTALAILYWPTYWFSAYSHRLGIADVQVALDRTEGPLLPLM